MHPKDGINIYLRAKCEREAVKKAEASANGWMVYWFTEMPDIKENVFIVLDTDNEDDFGRDQTESK